MRIVVVGGGISGLTAAWRLAGPGGAALAPAPGGDPLEIVVLEQAAQPGGKLRLGEIGGVALDVGAESVLARRPEAVDLIRAVGLGDDLVHPVASAASVLARGHLYPLPTGTVMGVPADPVTVAGLAGPLTAAEVARAGQEPADPEPVAADDVDVASWVAGRVGRAVVDRLVEPLLGGVYAGPADRLSLRATVPALWARARAGTPLLAGPPAAPPGRGAGGPVFAGIRGGVGRLPLVLRDRLVAAGVAVRTGVTVRRLERTAAGWRLETGSAADPAWLAADAVMLAVPPPAAARLLREASPAASSVLADLTTASVAVVATAIPRAQLAGVTGTGLLIPPVEGTAIKAATFSSSKWGWMGEDPAAPLVVRLSLGRAGEEGTLQHADEELIARGVADLAAVLGRPVRPVDAAVTRWGGALPQYDVGHLERVRRIRAAVAEVPGLAICGAALDGVGVPACIAAADRAAGELLERLPVGAPAGRRAPAGPGGGQSGDERL